MPQKPTWHGYTESVDISRNGIKFGLAHPVDWGDIVRVRLALPRELRVASSDSPVYFAEAMVCHSVEEPDGTHVIGAEFGMALEVPADLRTGDLCA